MDMGTGKTKVALDLIKSRQQDFDIVIWIAPASLIREKSYKAEIEKWSDGLNRKVYYFTIEGVSQSDRKYLEMHNLAEKYNSFCVVDESITIKNTEAGRTQRLLKMWNMFKFRIILNGTPLTKGLIDLYSQIQFIHPNILNMTETQFAHNFLQFKKEGWKPWKRWSKPENEQALIEIIRPYIFDADLDLDKKINYEDFEFYLNEAESNDYYKHKTDYLQGKFRVQFLAMAQYFQHYYTQKSHKKYLKLEQVLNEIKERKEKVIIYVKFLDEVEEFVDTFNAVEFTGKNKKNSIEKFKNEKDIMICTYGVGSMGLNLQFCNNIIYYTQTFDYKDKEQSMHRVYRTGQQKDVNIYNFWVNTGLEKIIKASLSKKQNVLNNVKSIISKKEALKL
jgi:SNF2 family DNA or RNA helicase